MVLPVRYDLTYIINTCMVSYHDVGQLLNILMYNYRKHTCILTSRIGLSPPSIQLVLKAPIELKHCACSRGYHGCLTVCANCAYC